MIKASLVLVSDIHIIDEADPKFEKLLNLLRCVNSNVVEYFILNGDIFDFLFGGSSYFQKRFSSLQQELKRLHNLGVKIIYLQGNHEFSLKYLGWEGVQLLNVKDFTFALKDGTTFCLAHGDQLYSPWHYKLYQFIVQSELFCMIACLIPQRPLERFCLKISELSRQKTKELPLDKIKKTLADWLEQKKTNHALVGHFHYPFYEKSHDGGGYIVGTRDWDYSPNCVTFFEGEFSRIKL